MGPTGSTPGVEQRAAAEDFRSVRLLVSRWVALESLDDRTAVVYHTSSRARLELSSALYRFLRRFTRPSSVEEALGRPPDDQVMTHVRRLVDKGFLAVEGRDEAPARTTTTSACTMFNCPTYRPDRPAPAVSFLGVPYDLGSPTGPGVRRAPAEIRRRSLDFEYRIDFDSGRPRGWFDADRATRILAGVTLADWGDVAVEYGEAQPDLFARVGGVIDEILGAGSIPVVLGGDHSIAFPVVERLQARHQLAVLFLDAHTDFDPAVPRGTVTDYSVGRRLWELGGVSRLFQVGHRGFTVNAKAENAPEGVEIISASAARALGADGLADRLPEGVPLYVSLDVNVLDPVYAPGSVTPTPGGFDLDELKTLLRSTCGRREIVGLDVVGLDPAKDAGAVTAISICHLVLSAAGAIFAR